MAKAKKTPDIDIPMLDTPDGGETVKTVTIADMDKFPAKGSIASAKGQEGSTKAIDGIDFSSLGDDEDDDFLSLDSKPIADHHWVLVKFIGANNSPQSFHAQSVNGVKATYRMGRWTLTKMYFISASKNSGRADYQVNPGAAGMKFVRNRPQFEIRDMIPDEYQDDGSEGIQAFKDYLLQEKGRDIPFATNIF